MLSRPLAKELSPSIGHDSAGDALERDVPMALRWAEDGNGALSPAQLLSWWKAVPRRRMLVSNPLAYR